MKMFFRSTFKLFFISFFALFRIVLPVKASPALSGMFYGRKYLCVNISEGGDTFAALKGWKMRAMPERIVIQINCPELWFFSFKNQYKKNKHFCRKILNICPLSTNFLKMRTGYKLWQPVYDIWIHTCKCLGTGKCMYALNDISV